MKIDSSVLKASLFNEMSDDLMRSLVFEALLVKTEILTQLARYGEAIDAVDLADRILDQLHSEKPANSALRVRYRRAMIKWRLGDLDEARKLVEVGLSELLDADDADIVLHAKYLNLQGNIHGSCGNFDQAITDYCQSIDLATMSGNKYDLAAALNNLGMTYRIKGEFDVALTCLEESLKLKEELGNKHQIAVTLNNIGLIYSDKNDLGRALSYFRKSLQLKEELENQSQLVSTLNNIALIHYRRGELEEALFYLQRCLELDKKIGNKQDIAISLNNIGTVYQTMGKLEQALEYLEQSLKLKEEIGNDHDTADSVFNIGKVYRSQGNMEKALDCFKHSLALQQKIGNHVDMAESLFHLLLTLLELPNQSSQNNASEYLAMSFLAFHIETLFRRFPALLPSRVKRCRLFQA